MCRSKFIPLIIYVEDNLSAAASPWLSLPGLQLPESGSPVLSDFGILARVTTVLEQVLDSFCCRQRQFRGRKDLLDLHF